MKIVDFYYEEIMKQKYFNTSVWNNKITNKLNIFLIRHIQFYFALFSVIILLSKFVITQRLSVSLSLLLETASHQFLLIPRLFGVDY